MSDRVSVLHLTKSTRGGLAVSTVLPDVSSAEDTSGPVESSPVDIEGCSVLRHPRPRDCPILDGCDGRGRWSIVAGCGFSVSPGTTADASDTRVDRRPARRRRGCARRWAAARTVHQHRAADHTLDSVAGEDDPTLTGDMLEIYFDRGGDIWFSVRASVAVSWPAPQALAVVNSAASETTTEISADGLELFFCEYPRRRARWHGHLCHDASRSRLGIRRPGARRRARDHRRGRHADPGR